MPWKETTIMEQKIEFICEWRTGKYTVTELSRAFNISRPTAYKMIERFEKSGYDGLSGLLRSPKNHPNQTPDKIVDSNLELKEKTSTEEQRKLGN